MPKFEGKVGAGNPLQVAAEVQQKLEMHLFQQGRRRLRLFLLTNQGD